MIELRPYQTDLIDRTRASLRTHRSCLIVSPTGSGKTALTASMLGTAAERGRRAWFIVHRRELVMQTARTFFQVGIPHGIVAAGFRPSPGALVQICMVQTLDKRRHKLARPNFIVTDEAHHTAAATWARIIGDHSDAYHVGLTATPERLDGTGLGAWFEDMVQGPSTADLIRDGYLSPYRLFAPSVPDLTAVRSRAGDFAAEALVDAMDTPSITGDAVMHYLKLAPGKRAIVFCASIAHSLHVRDQFLHVGVPTVHVDGDSETTFRDRALASFAAGDIKVLCNVDLFGEGVDVPGIECVINLRPTQSLGLALQQWGRGLRPKPDGGECIILDHAGNALRHGLPDDPRTWSLDGAKRKKNAAAVVVAVRQCPACYRVMSAYVRVCDCGHVWIPHGREVEERAGELVEMDPDTVRRSRYWKERSETNKAQTLEDLVALAKGRRYKNPIGWAKAVFNGRRRRA